jgi:tRNA A37 threonylcarbamoyladenosine synthetase subunit TsaC/SUA5/YrdC
VKIVDVKKLRSRKRQSESVFEIVEALRSGAIAIAPIEQGYVFIADLYSEDATSRIKKIKNLSEEIYFPLLVSSVDQIAPFSGQISAEQRLLAMEFWPGMLAFECQVISGAFQTFGSKFQPTSLFFRCAANTLLKEICELMGAVIYSPVMEDGQIVTSTKNINAEIQKECEFIIVGSDFTSEKTPTIISFVGAVPTLTKIGVIEEAKIRKLTPNLKTN